MITLAKRFWSKVDIRGDNECWPWLASKKNAMGHGQINVGGKIECAHRIALSLHKGQMVDSPTVRHSCDNPPCCNPAHLIEGSDQDNVDDMLSRRRGRVFGREQKIAPSDHPDILKAYASGKTQREIGEQYGVTQARISAIILKHKKENDDRAG